MKKFAKVGLWAYLGIAAYILLTPGNTSGLVSRITQALLWPVALAKFFFRR
jgi:hypothetical protein